MKFHFFVSWNEKEWGGGPKTGFIGKIFIKSLFICYLPATSIR